MTKPEPYSAEQIEVIRTFRSAAGDDEWWLATLDQRDAEIERLRGERSVEQLTCEQLIVHAKQAESRAAAADAILKRCTEPIRRAALPDLYANSMQLAHAQKLFGTLSDDLCAHLAAAPGEAEPCADAADTVLKQVVQWFRHAVTGDGEWPGSIMEMLKVINKQLDAAPGEPGAEQKQTGACPRCRSTNKDYIAQDCYGVDWDDAQMHEWHDTEGGPA